MINPGIDYQAVLADLEERKANIEAAIDGVKAILGEVGGIPHAKGDFPVSVSSDTFFGMSIVDATVKYLRMNKSKKSTREIVDALESGGMTTTSKNFTNTVYALLFRSQKLDGEVIRVGNGWGLAEWYPGRNRGRLKNTEDKESKNQNNKDNEVLSNQQKEMMKLLTNEERKKLGINQ